MFISRVSKISFLSLLAVSTLCVTLRGVDAQEYRWSVRLEEPAGMPVDRRVHRGKFNPHSSFARQAWQYQEMMRSNYYLQRVLWQSQKNAYDHSIQQVSDQKRRKGLFGFKLFQSGKKESPYLQPVDTPLMTKDAYRSTRQVLPHAKLQSKPKQLKPGIMNQAIQNSVVINEEPVVIQEKTSPLKLVQPGEVISSKIIHEEVISLEEMEARKDKMAEHLLQKRQDMKSLKDEVMQLKNQDAKPEVEQSLPKKIVVEQEIHSKPSEAQKSEPKKIESTKMPWKIEQFKSDKTEKSVKSVPPSKLPKIESSTKSKYQTKKW